jgi:hypothetical protein
MRNLLIIALLAITVTAFAGRRGQGNRGNRGNGDRPCMNNNKENAKVYKLTDAQKKDLTFMYEEEKMARDLYIALGDKWNLRPFLNIQNAEQRHMDSVKNLLDKYKISVSTPKENGKFNDSDIQKLYDKLLKKGLKSQTDALEVGKLVEVTDIKDLEEKIKTATPDVKFVFSNLLKGSNNHLNAFNRWLEK